MQIYNILWPLHWLVMIKFKINGIDKRTPRFNLTKLLELKINLYLNTFL